MKDKITIKEYIEYLQRYIRNKEKSLWKAHQNAIHRMVAMETYGVTEEELLWLDDNL